MKRILIFFLTIQFLTNCAAQSTNIKNNESQVTESNLEPSVSSNNQASVETKTIKNITEESIKNTNGLIFLSDRYGKNDFVHFYNEDGSIWYKFSYHYDDKDGRFEYENDNFRAFAFHPDYFLLALKCVAEDKNRYEVIVNEETGLKKFVRKDDKTLKFETWGKHLLKTFLVDFNINENPLRETPNGIVKNVELPKDVTFQSAEIKSEWLKLKWDVESNPDNDPKKTDFGWIRWKKDEKLLVDLFYFA